MHGINEVFFELTLVCGLGALVSLALRHARIPPVAGLLVAGALTGPHGFGLLSHTEGIELLAEVGVTLLLFTIGLEFSLERIRSMARLVILGGALQVGLTALAATLAMRGTGAGWPLAILVGFIFALSSTAVVLRTLSERQELDAPHGRLIVGVLIFQDLVVVAMLLMIPALAAGDAGAVTTSLAAALGKTVLVVGGALLAARWLLPKALRWVESSRSRDVFTLAMLAMCFGTACFTAHLGLSLALGAFLAGMLIADSEYAHRVLDDALPARDVLTSLFFVSMGMLFNPQVLVAEPVRVALLLAGFVLGKGLIAACAALVMRFPARVAWLAGVSLAQFGEFGFVIAAEGMRAGILPAEEAEVILAAGLLSMFITRLLIAAAPRFSAGEAILRPLERLLQIRGIHEPAAEDAAPRDHVVIVGFGPGGRMLAERLESAHRPFLVLELNARTVREARLEGVPIYYGDINGREARRHARIAAAAAVVLQINDHAATARAVSAIRSDGHAVPILARARRAVDAAQLLALGADYVASEEEEASATLCQHAIQVVAQCSDAAAPA